MTKFKRGLIIGSMVLALGATSLTALAANENAQPARNAAACTAEDKTERLQDKKDFLAAKVAAGTITQEKADEITAALDANQAVCDGTGSAKIGQSLGAGFGGMNGNGQGNNGNCNGTGEHQGNSQGNKGECNGTGERQGNGTGERQGNGQGNCGNCAE